MARTLGLLMLPCKFPALPLFLPSFSPLTCVVNSVCVTVDGQGYGELVPSL